MRSARTLPISLATLLTVATLPLGGTPAAAATRTINLVSGFDGGPCEPDASVTFTSNSVITPQPAVTGTGAPGNPCEVHRDLPGGVKCHNVTTTNSADVSAEFRITFTLPLAFTNPELDIRMKVDDVADVYLNGHSLGLKCRSVQLVHLIQDANPAHFVVGTNTLSFFVNNNPGCSPTPTARAGPEDAMNVEFEGTVTYDAPGGGINLGWYECGGLPASLNEDFACNTNVGIHTLVGSYRAPCCITGASANEIVMDMQTAGVTLAAWWGMRSSGTCRTSASLLSSFNFTSGPFTCHDYWQGGASGGISQDPPVLNRVRIKALGALPSNSPLITGVPEGTEVYSFKANINNARTTGPGACAGCTAGACIVLQSIKINQPASEPGGSKWIGNPATRAFVTWQGGNGPNCYGATPARNVTWGSVKAIYR